MPKLYPYQKKAIDNMRSGSILCGGVGSGKSRTAIGYFLLKECKGEIDGDRIYIKAPKSLYIITTARKRDTLEWDKELSAFALSKDQSVSLFGIKVVIDSWNNISKYIEVTDSFFIFDEQRVVGSGRWAKSFIAISKSNKWILLSATPGDTWMDYIPVFIANGFYKNRTQFIKRHVVFSRFSKYPKVERYLDEEVLEQHRKAILINMDYYKKTQPHDIFCYTTFDKEAMDQIIKKRWNVYEDEPIKDAQAYCYIMRRLVNSDPSKLEAIKEILDSKKKAIIFYNFNYELENLKSFLESKGIPYSEWNGHKHERIKFEYEKWAYLVQYTAGAEGWNCIETDTIIFFSQNYSYKLMTQAKGRIDRLNSPFVDLYYFHLVSKSQIDRAILSALSKKQNFNEKSIFF